MDEVVARRSHLVDNAADPSPVIDLTSPSTVVERGPVRRLAHGDDDVHHLDEHVDRPVPQLAVEPRLQRSGMWSLAQIALALANRCRSPRAAV
ncbi:hypothetical protein [Actinoplanes nipponensis]|uniref:hypothetical protein n=1 Tax=Actinoplanes nipponensis TaxID=135950 RepID=UPI0031E85222